MLSINTNMASITAQNKLSSTQGDLSQAMERLSSGRRINSAADDAAGYSVATSMDKQIRGLDQAGRNVNDGISLTQTALGAIEEMSNMMQRMRELAVQGASETYGGDDRDAMHEEFTNLISEIDRIATTTKFNGIPILDGTAGTAGALNVQAGWENTAANAIVIQTNAMDSTTLGINALDLSAATGDPNAAMTALDTAITSLTTQASSFGAVQNRLEYTADNLNNISEKITAAKSRIFDADFSSESAALSKANVLQQAGTAMLSQANQQPQQVLQLLR